MKSIYFNKDIYRIIYQYDPTYHIIFKNKVLPYLKKEWVIQWKCKKTFTKGLNLNGYSGLMTGHRCSFNGVSTKCNNLYHKYTFRNCVKKCKEKDLFYTGFFHNPIHVKNAPQWIRW